MYSNNVKNWSADMESAPRDRAVQLRCIEDGAVFLGIWNPEKGDFVDERTGLQINPLSSTYEWKLVLNSELEKFLADFERLVNFMNENEGSTANQDVVTDCYTTITSFFELSEIKKALSICNRKGDAR